MTLQSTPPKEDSKSFLKTLKKTTAMALLSVSTLALSTSCVQASLGAGAEEQAPSAKLLAQWDGKIKEARAAFVPVLQALKLLADPDFRADVEREQGTHFATYEKEKVAEAWAQKTKVVDFLKDLYGAHTKLIPEYERILTLLSQAQDNLGREQGVSANLREDLQAAQAAVESLQEAAQSFPAPSAVDAAALEKAQRLLAAEQEKTAAPEEQVRQMSTINGGAGDERDLERGQKRPSSADPLLGDSAGPVSSSNSWRTTVFFTVGGTVIGAGLGALFTWLFLSHKA